MQRIFCGRSLEFQLAIFDIFHSAFSFGFFRFTKSIFSVTVFCHIDRSDLAGFIEIHAGIHGVVIVFIIVAIIEGFRTFEGNFIPLAFPDIESNVTGGAKFISGGCTASGNDDAVFVEAFHCVSGRSSIVCKFIFCHHNFCCFALAVYSYFYINSAAFCHFFQIFGRRFLIADVEFAIRCEVCTLSSIAAGSFVGYGGAGEVCHFPCLGVFILHCYINSICIQYILTFTIYFFILCFCVQSGIYVLVRIIVNDIFDGTFCGLFAVQIVCAVGVNLIFCGFACVFTFQIQIAIFQGVNIPNRVIFFLSGRFFIQQINLCDYQTVEYQADSVAFGQAADGQFSAAIFVVNTDIIIGKSQSVPFAVVHLYIDIVIIAVMVDDFCDFTCVCQFVGQQVIGLVHHHCHFRTGDVCCRIEVAAVVTCHNAQSGQQIHIRHGFVGNTPYVVVIHASTSVNVVFFRQCTTKHHSHILTGCRIGNTVGGELGQISCHQNLRRQTISHCGLAPCRNLVSVQHRLIDRQSIGSTCFQIACFAHEVVYHHHSFAVSDVVFRTESAVLIAVDETFVGYSLDGGRCPGHFVDIGKCGSGCCHGQTACHQNSSQCHCHFAFHVVCTSFGIVYFVKKMIFQWYLMV